MTMPTDSKARGVVAGKCPDGHWLSQGGACLILSYVTTCDTCERDLYNSTAVRATHLRQGHELSHSEKFIEVIHSIRPVGQQGEKC